MTFTPTVPCRTKFGGAVEILTILPPEKMTKYGETIVALVKGADGYSVETYTPDGRYLGQRGSVWDLVNVQEKNR